MKKFVLLMVFLVVGAAGLHAQLVIGPNAAGDTGLAVGTHVNNPDPGGIPNGSTIDAVSTFGNSSQIIFIPPGGMAQSVTIMGFMGFMAVGGGPATGMSPMAMTQITANEQTGLTGQGPAQPPAWTSQDQVESNIRQDLEDIERIDDAYKAVLLMFTGKTVKEIFGPDIYAYYDERSANAAAQQSDNAAANHEAPVTVVPVVGDLGGQVEENL